MTFFCYLFVCVAKYLQFSCQRSRVFSAQTERCTERDCSGKCRLWPPSQHHHTGFIRLGLLRNQQPHRGGELHTQAASVLTGQKRWSG